MKFGRVRHRLGAFGLLPILFAAASGAAALVAPGATEDAVANGDTRTVHLHHAHTHESIDATYLVDGRYDPVVLEKLNWFLRDWRRDEPTHMDPKLFDTVWEVYRESGSGQPIEVMSAYRSPETNAMLRRASRSVAEHSQHILGKAMDQHYADVPMSRIREIAMRLQRGGVGFYPTAGTPFVHMDVGGVRHWPKMSYDQLSRLFPDGKTVHIPSNGQPLAGYEEARAELAARGDGFDYPTAGQVKSKGFFAWLFGGGDDEGDGEAAREGGARRDAAPGPRRKGGTQVASIDPVPVGSTSDDRVSSNNGREPASGFFSLFSSQPVPPTPAPAAAPAADAGARGRRGRSTAQALVASLPSVDPQAQQVLAQEMQRQGQIKAQQAADAQAQAAADAQVKAAAQAQAAAEAQQLASAQKAADARPVRQVEAAAGAEASAVPPEAMPALASRAAPVLARADVPLPPRRPVEIAALGPAAPALPNRPDPASAARNDRAPLPPSARAGLPAAILQGSGPPIAPARALAFAPAPPPVVPPAPLPVARPSFVAARLDRSNFRSLTGATPTDRLPARPGMGSAVSALRPAAQASASALAADGAASPRRGFGARASDLATDHFSGTAVTAGERVSTAALHRRSAAAPGDE